MSGTRQQDIGGIPVSVTLPVATWNRVVDILGRSPWHDVNQLILAIAQPMQDQVNRAQTPMAPPLRPNGEDHAEAGLPPQ
jgi:hypothetical protein